MSDLTRASEALLWDLQDGKPMSDSDIADRLAAIEAEARADTLGAAWERVERALPEGWYVESLYMGTSENWFAGVCAPSVTEHPRFRYGHGSTPVAALTALAEKLEEQR